MCYQAGDVPQECPADPGDRGDQEVVGHLHLAPGRHDEGVRAPVPGPDRLLDPVRRPLPVDDRAASRDSQRPLHTAALSGV